MQSAISTSKISNPARSPSAIVLRDAAQRRRSAQARYSAKQTGDIVQLRDARTDTTVSVMTSVSNAYEMVVKGQNLIRMTFATVDEFRARPGLNGIPLLAPFANRLDEQAFYANGKKYNFDMELGNVRGADPDSRLPERREGLEARRSQGRRQRRVGDQQARLLSQSAVDEAVSVRAHVADDVSPAGRRARGADAHRQPQRRADAGRDRLPSRTSS